MAKLIARRTASVISNSLTKRETPRGEYDPSIALHRRDISTRATNFRSATIDEANRSVEVIMATDAPVTVWDWDRGLIDEVLVAGGGQFPDQIPLLANHSRWSLDDVIGAVRAARQDGGQWLGRAFFASGDADSDKAWNKTRQGILRDVSVGYRSTEYTDIAPGMTQLVQGKSYTARSRLLRITTRWEAKELSLVPIGADEYAKVRGADGPRSDSASSTERQVQMDPILRKYLESLGLRTDASVDEAKAFHAGLGGKRKTRADAIALKSMTLDEATRGDATDAAAAVASAATTAADAIAATDTVDGGDGADTVDVAAGTRGATTQRNPATQARGAATQTPAEAVRLERERVASIRQLAANDIPAELMNRAIDEGWPTTRASTEFLTSIRERRGGSAGADAPAGIVGNRDRDCNLRSLGFAMAMRAGVNIERYAQRNNIQGWQNIATQADRYNDMSIIDLCRECCRLDGREVPHNRQEAFRAAVSGGSLTNVFTTAANARLMQGWEESEDTTAGWIEEVDENDFKTVTAIMYNGQTGLDKLPRGKTANHAAPDDASETYAVARYAKQFSIDEQDAIDDTFSVFQTTPYEFGQGARRLRPDLIYSILLANPTLAATTGALFNATALTSSAGHANLQTGALAAATLQASIVAMAKQYIKKGKTIIPLNLKPAFLIVPQDLVFTAQILLTSVERMIAADSGGTANPLKGLLEVRADNRIGVGGVTDPNTGTAYTGTATNYFLAARPGRTLRVAYRRGTNRSPMIRSFTLDKGQWGIGWDVNMDIGAKAMDFRGLLKSTGA